MAVDDASALAQLPSWIGRVPGPGTATLLFPHAGGSAVNYRPLALALATGADTYVMQYPQRADRYREPVPDTLPELARDLFDAAPWHQLGPLRLFGHSMGSIVAFEFARIAEQRGIEIQRLWASAGRAPGTVADQIQLSTDHATLLADLTDLGGTDARLLADDEFARLLTGTLAADYRALNRYRCAPDVTIGADIHVLGGRDDTMVTTELLARWADHTTGACTLSLYDGGHFYHYEHVDALATRIIADA